MPCHSVPEIACFSRALCCFIVSSSPLFFLSGLLRRSPSQSGRTVEETLAVRSCQLSQSRPELVLPLVLLLLLVLHHHIWSSDEQSFLSSFTRQRASHVAAETRTLLSCDSCQRRATRCAPPPAPLPTSACRDRRLPSTLPAVSVCCIPLRCCTVLVSQRWVFEPNAYFTWTL